MGIGLNFSLPPYVESVENQIDDENLLQTSMTFELPEIKNEPVRSFQP